MSRSDAISISFPSLYSPADIVGAGGGGVDAFLSQGFDPLPTQRVPLWTIMRYPFLAD